MGKHKHRHRSEMAMNVPMQQGFSPEMGQYNNGSSMGNGNMNMNMNGGNEMSQGQPGMGGNGIFDLLASSLGLGGQMGGQMGGQNMGGGNNILSMLSGLLGGNQNQGGNQGDLLGNLFSAISGGNAGGGNQKPSLGGLESLFGSLQKSSPKDSNANGSSKSIEDILANINERDMRKLKGMVDEILVKKYGAKDIDLKREDVDKRESSGTNMNLGENQSDEVSVEKILFNLDFNNILKALNQMDMGAMNFGGFATDDSLIKNENVKEADIVSENNYYIDSSLNLSEKELYKLINTLINLVEPEKLHVLKKYFNSDNTSQLEDISEEVNSDEDDNVLDKVIDAESIEDNDSTV